MSTREKIQAEIETLNRQELEELFALILEFIESKRQAKAEGVLSRLAQIQIEGPLDLSENHDLYITGEKFVVANSD